jgi:ATP-dependent helicase/nuclease subunit B
VRNKEQERGTIVTGNARLSRQLLREYDAERRKHGERLWESPDILPCDAWLARCWQECAYRDPLNTPVLLDAAQEEALWERAVAKAAADAPLLDIAATASAAVRAWDLLHAWETPRDTSAFESAADDPQAFFGWMAEVEQKLRDNGWITASQLPGALRDRVAAGKLSVPTPVSYTGFDELTPADRRLFDALAVSERRPHEPSIETTVCRAAYRDPQEELARAAAWARRQLEASPGARIGVVVRGLAELSAAAERIFDDALHPGLDFAPSDSRRAFHVSAGALAADVPLIAAALLMLRLRDGLALGEAAMLLRSPFLRIGQKEAGQLDRDLRRAGAGEVSLDAVRPHFRAFAEAARDLPPHQRFSQWSATFARLLTLAGWPGDRTLSSAEYQALEHWKKLLSEFARLDVVLLPVSYGEALERLRRMAQASRFAPSDEDAPVQIMDVLEAAGSRFDRLWIAGLHGGIWPPPPRPSPFLPLALQRAVGMPHSSPERELAYARRVTERLLDSAPEVVCSYPQYSGDEKLRVSPLIENLPEATGLPEAAETAMQRIFSTAPVLDRPSLGDAPPLFVDVVQSGGIRVIADQAACPFRAFAIHRLGARELDDIELGVSPRERGTAAHESLHILWQELKSHHELMESPPARLSELIQSSVSEALDRTLGRRQTGAIEQFRILEQARLERLLKEWLEVERRREPFRVIETETKAEVELAGLQLRIKADRVDLDEATGGHAIVDYKTSKVLTTTGWDGERPDAPQLPLYAVKSEHRVSKIFYGQLVSNKLRWLPAEGADAEKRLPEWKRVLKNLAADFLGGRAAVDPKDGAKTCENCKLGPLCRIGELRGLEMEAGDSDE